MRGILAAAAVVLLGSAPALAADDVMAGFYGNTLIVTGDAFQAHVHYSANHTFDISGTASGQAFSTKGSWKIDAKGQLCRSYEKAVPTVPNPFCSEATARKVGDTWTATTPDGSSRNITLVAGIK
ncbi:MAG TPA: hypothetical protein VGG92_17310 [Caulobacteraceae bacterium]|jgi:opacity protein-like surface antigen